MSYITVTEKGVLKILLGHKQHKAACPDKVLTRLLKLGAKELAKGMTKEGNRSTPSNYSPISLASISC
jgi:hypothetical protein